ncbi:MAG: hypothetical protein NUV83_02805 [Candidatus Wolfebacteria bacterium]|nr:hypothetical protein [Candidatus Wolfebacteria bacterium]
MPSRLNVVHLTTALQEKLKQVKNNADIQTSCQNPREFTLLCGLAEFLTKRLEGLRIEVVGFTIAAYVAIDDLWIGIFTGEDDNNILNAYPLLLTIKKYDYDFLNSSVPHLTKSVFGLTSLTDIPRKIDLQSFPKKYLNMMNKTCPR